MLDLAAWGPTIVTLIMWVFFGGIAWNKLSDHGKRLDNIEPKVEEHSVQIAEVNSWKQGYAAARSVYQPHGASALGGD